MGAEDLIDGWQDMEAALPDYLEAEAYFDGTVPEVFASAAGRQLLERTGDRYRFNLAKTPVCVRRDRVEIAAITAPDNDEANDTIEDVWDANDMAVHYPELFLLTFEYGDAYLMGWPLDVEDEADAEIDEDRTGADDRLAEAGYELTVHNPKNVRVFYDPEHPRRKAYAIKRWCVRGADKQKQWRADVYYPDRVERWLSAVGADLKAEDGWGAYLDVDQDADDWLLDNPTGRIPFGHYRTALPYGVPLHRDAFSPQDAINKLLITQLTTADSHGWPQRWMLTDRAASLDTVSDTPDWGDDADSDDTAEGNRGGSSSQLKSGPGTILDLTGKSAVGQFQAADPAVFLTPAEFFIRLMAQMTTTPLHYFDPGGAVPSGESLKVADMPLTKDCEHLTAMLRAPVVEDWTAVLEMHGIEVDRLDVSWAPIESSTGKSDWETTKAKQDAGVPRAQALVEAGYEAGQVEQWHADEAEALDLAHRVQLIGAVGDAVQRLGVGVSTGALSQEQANAFVARVMGDAVGEVAGDDAGNEARAKRLAEMGQKLYLGVNIIYTAEEARGIMNAAGAGFTGPPPEPRSQWDTSEDQRT